jgi:hypothetical protein
VTAALDPQVVADATRALRRVLAAVNAGQLDQGGPDGRALTLRLEGAVSALESTADPDDERSL